MWRHGNERHPQAAPWRLAPPFRELPEETLDVLADAMQRREVPTNHYLTRQGAETTELLWVKTGSIELIEHAPDRNVECQVDTIGAGDCIGDLALIDGLPSATSARTLSPGVVWALVAVYALSCLVQELIARAALQSSLEMFLTGPRRIIKAIAVPALLFARKRNLAGVTLSHIVGVLSLPREAG